MSRVIRHTSCDSHIAEITGRHYGVFISAQLSPWANSVLIFNAYVLKETAYCLVVQYLICVTRYSIAGEMNTVSVHGTPTDTPNRYQFI